MEVGGAVWHGLCALGRWLFISECRNASALLSLSFAVNLTFAKSSLSRLNPCVAMGRLALKWVRDTLDDKFLSEIVRLGKGDKKVAQKLVAHSLMMEQFVAAMEEDGALRWGRARQWSAICFAVIAFVLMAFDVRTRVGVALVLPYLILLLCHAIWTVALTAKVMFSRRGLLKAKYEAEKSKRDIVDVAACANRLMTARKALSPQTDAKRGGKQLDAEKSRKAAKAPTTSR